MLHTTLVLSIVPSSSTEPFRPTIPQLSPSSTTAVVLKLFLSFPTLNKGVIQAPPVPHRSHKMGGQAPYFRAILPEGTQVQVWPDVISQCSPHLFSASLPVITSCPIQIKALQIFFFFKLEFFFFFFYWKSVV